MTQRTPENRLREHPKKRFEPVERKLDLDEALEELLDEPHEGVQGHRQITIDRRGRLTLILFHFAEGATLPDHQVDGQVHIQVLNGELEIRTENDSHQLSDNEILVLAPGVSHDVDARRETQMLLTVCLEHERIEKRA